MGSTRPRPLHLRVKRSVMPDTCRSHRWAMVRPILPQSGRISYPIRDAAAIPGALAPFRLACERATARREIDH